MLESQVMRNARVGSLSGVGRVHSHTPHVQVKMLLPKKKLKPRTFRAAAGQTVFIGGLVRVDVVESPGATLYITVWASDELICHFGRTEAADDR